jgi:hypothetical protein
MNIKFHDSDKYLIGEDGLKVPVDNVKIMMPKQMTVESLALITTCIYVVKILVIVPIVTIILSLLLSSRAIVRIVSSILTLEMFINLGLTSYDYPENMKFLLQFMKSFFQGRKIIDGTGLGEHIGLQNFIEVTRTNSYS